VQHGQVKQGDASWVSWLVIIGCLPAGLLGVALEDPLKHLFASPLIAATFLVINGVLLLVGEWWRRHATVRRSWHNARGSGPGQPAYQLGLPPEKRAAPGLPPRAWEQDRRSMAAVETLPLPVAHAHSGHNARPLESLTWREAVLLGLAQALALIPGISRSGVTMVVGLGVGLSHEDAAHYALLLGTPLIAGAALLEIPQLTGAAGSTIVLIAVGMVLSGLAAYLSTAFLMRYFETGRLHPFAIYCLGLGGMSLVLFLLGVGVQ
jgi:undecaprenyl-diphosphatase